MTPGRCILPLFVALALGAGPAACTRGGAPVERHAAASDARPPGMHDGASIFDLDLALVDQDGRQLALKDLGGHPMVAAMMYSSCTSVCPRVTEDMKAIAAQVSAGDRPDVRFVLFSLDPGRDTPAALRGFAAEHRLDSVRWRLLAASEDGVRDLAAVLGVKYRPDEAGQIAHSAMIFVIDRNGVVRHRQVGLGQDSRELVAALAQTR